MPQDVSRYGNTRPLSVGSERDGVASPDRDETGRRGGTAIRGQFFQSPAVQEPENYPFAAIEISAGIPGAVVVETPLMQTFSASKLNPNVVGIIDISLITDVWDETGRVACYSPNGKKRWEERVRFGLGGSADHVAEKFTTRLAKKVSGKLCP